MSVTSHQRIRILHVDDEGEFADLTGTFLEREDDRFTVETATSADEGLERLTDRPPDCVVSDYNMPGMDGIEFLKAVREEYPDLPFILFTGKGSEAVASDAIAADVTDYLQKSSGSEKYELLANRIRNAVRQHRSEERLRETQREYAAVFENVQNGLLLVDVEPDGFRYQRCNPRAAELIGRERTEIEGKSPYEALGPENGEKVVDAYRTCSEQGNPVEYTVTLDLPMGKVIRECEATPVAANGAVGQLVVAFRDITERRLRQQELRRNKRAMDEAPVGITITDPEQEDNPIIYANNGFRSLTGYADDEILGRNCRFLQGEDTSPESVATLREAIDSEERVTDHLRNYREDGTEFWNRVSIAPVRDDDGSVVNFVGFQQDITDHKQRELELERARDLLDRTERLADVGGWEIDTETMEVHWTENLFDLLGVDYDEEPPLDEALSIYHDDDRPLVENAVETALDAGESFDVEARFHRPDGELRWLRVQGTPTTDDGSVVTLRGTVQDITEQKRMERALRQERDLVTGIVETSPVGIAVVTADGDVSFTNERASTIAGWPSEELEEVSHNHSRYDMVNESGDSLEAGDAPFDRVMSQEEPIHNHVVGMRRPSGERVWLSVSGAPQWDETGELERAIFAFEDITEQRELEVEFEEMLGRVSDAFYALDDEFRFTHINERAEELLQASEDDLLGETLWDMFPAAAELDEDGIDLHAAMETQEPQSHELYYEPLDLWTEARIYPSESGVSVYFRDVTESKERKQELEQVRTRMEFALEYTDAIVWDYDVTEDRATFYPDETDLYGAAVETVDDFVQLIHPDDRQAVADSIEQSIETGDPIQNEFRIVRDGETRWMDSHGKVVQDGDDTTRMTGVVRDITERKTREQQLEQFREYTERIRDAIDDLFFLHDAEGNLQRWNDAFSQVTGYSDDETASMNGIEFVPAEHRERTAAAIEEVFETGHARLEAPLLTKRGETIPYEFAAARVDHPDGDPRLVGVGRDISERKEYEERLEAQNERLEEFASVVSHDLQSPLNVAQGRVDLLRDDCDSRQIDRIERAHDRMQGLIDDLLTLAREGKVVTDTESVELSEMAAKCWENVKTENASIVIDIDRTMLADRSRLKQVFENLMRNAIEHGEGTVTVTVGGLTDGFYIEDDGAGIPPSDRDDVFEAGYSTDPNGTGFGLRIAEQIVEAHDWTIDLTEGSEGGARFEITASEVAAN